MTAVTHSFSSGGTITASELNTNFSDLITLVTSVSNDQLAGGITWDKITDNNAISWSCLTLLPHTAAHDGTEEIIDATPNEFTLTSSYVTMCKFRPVMKSGVEGFLCAITVYANAVTASTTFPGIRFRLNGTTVLGGQAINLNTDDSFYIIAANDPITNPLATMSDGDYIEIAMGDFGGANTPSASGIYVYFGLKYRLNA